MVFLPLFIFFFFFNDTATTEIYTLSLHDALPILRDAGGHRRDRSTGQSARDIAAAGAREATRRERARSRGGAVRDRRLSQGRRSAGQDARPAARPEHQSPPGPRGAGRSARAPRRRAPPRHVPYYN